MIEQLKPCPFCGGTKVKIMAYPHFTDWSRPYHAECETVSCYAQGPWGDTEKDAAHLWNIRTNEKE